jgi:hypothetical protein
MTGGFSMFDKMTNYIGTKVIKAEPMTRGEYAKLSGRNSILTEKGESAHDEGYHVRYADGYESWSPKSVFEGAYQKFNSMNFGHALELLKQGFKVARTGWNGKGMFLYYVPAAAYPPSTEIAKKAFGDEDVPYGAYIAMKTAQGNVVPWLASQTDMLSDDWEVVSLEQ